MAVPTPATRKTVWRDDHKWLERHKDAAAMSEPGLYPLRLRELAHRPAVGHAKRS
jgi:hypothetical protein